MKIEVTVCNVCKQVDRPTHTYGITLGSKTVWVDLCDEDSAPLDELLGTAEPTAPTQEPPAPRTATKPAPAKRASSKKSSGTRKRPGRPSGMTVTPLEDIERRKQAQ